MPNRPDYSVFDTQIGLNAWLQKGDDTFADIENPTSVFGIEGGGAMDDPISNTCPGYNQFFHYTGWSYGHHYRCHSCYRCGY